jgi:hypothetical protein
MSSVGLLGAGQEEADLNERRWVNADGEGSDVCQTTLEFNTVRHSRKTKHTGARREEVPGVVIGMEPDQVAVEDTEQDFTANRQDPDQFYQELFKRSYGAVAHR